MMDIASVSPVRIENQQARTYLKKISTWTNRQVQQIETIWQHPKVRKVCQLIAYSTATLFATAAVVSLFASLALPFFAYAKAATIGSSIAAYAGIIGPCVGLGITHFCVTNGYSWLNSARLLGKQ